MNEADYVLSVLSSSFLFEGVESQELERILQDITPPSVFEKGEAIYSRHSFKQAIGIVVEGRIEILREEDGRRVLMNQLGPGGIFGAAALYGDLEEYVTDIRAMERCSVLFLSQEEMSAVMKRNFRVAENYIRFLSGRIRFLNQRIAGYTGGASDRRLALYLLEHRDEKGFVFLPRSMVALAEMMNIGRSSLYRSLDALIDAGLIARGDKGIAILDLQRLQAVVESPGCISGGIPLCLRRGDSLESKRKKEFT